VKTICPFLLACGLTLTALAQPAPPSFPPSGAPSDPRARREAMRERPARGTNVVVTPDAANQSSNLSLPAPTTPAAPGVPQPAQSPPPILPSSPLPTTPAAPATPGAPATPEAPGAPGAPTALGTPVATAKPAPAQEELIPAGTIDWVGSGGADLNQVLDYYAKLVGRTILRPANLQSPPILLRTETPLTRAEVVQALESVLAMNGVSLIPMGEKFAKAVPTAQANQEGAPIQRLEAEALPELGSYVTHITQLKYARPSELVQVLTPFAKVPNSILPIDSSQILVLRDYTENVKRMLELIEEVDVTVPSEFISEVIPIKYAIATDIANALNSLSSGGGGTSVGSRPSGGRSTTPGARPGTGLPGQPGTTTLGMQQPGQPATAAGQSSFSDRLQQIIRRASTSGDMEIIGQNKIIADERSNSLLVFAMRQDMEMIKDVISKLDVVLAQVLIETTILDVSLNNRWNLGISAAQTTRDLGGGVLGAGSANHAKFFNFGGGTNNPSEQLLGQGLRYFLNVDRDFFINLEAAASDGAVRVIQKPRIQTSHATPASFFVGETVPYITGTYYGGWGGGPSAQYQQLRVGIQLNVTPFINPDGLVLMQIDQAIEELGEDVEIENVGKVPKTKSRTLTAEIAVRDGESIILGGYIRSFGTKSHAGVPLLKDIPLLGALFRSNSSQNDRSELMVLMRPIVLRTPELASALAVQERARLPGISRAEQEFEKEETLRIKKHHEKTARDKTEPSPSPTGTSTANP